MKRQALFLILTLSLFAGKVAGQCVVINTPAAVCSPATVDLTAPAVTAGSLATAFTYWTNAGATTPLASPNAVAISGTYYIKGTGIDLSCPDILPVTVTINPLLPVSVSIGASANPICAGTPVTFTATPVNGGTTPTYQWYNGATPVGTNSATYTYSPANSDAISVVMTSNETCKSGSPATSNTVTMVVNPILPVSVTVAASANPVCAGTPVTFTATPVNGGTTPTYQWYQGATPVGTNSATYTYTPVNGDAISVVLTSNETCKSGSPATSNTVTMVVNPLPAANAITGTAAICAGTLAEPYAVTTDNTGTATYAWSYSGANVTLSALIGNSITIDFANNATSGTLTVVETITLTGCSKSNTKSITVNPLPTLSGANQAAAVCDGSAATINLTGLLAGSTSTVAYTINSVAQTAVTGVVANGSGTASFTSAVLTSANNGQILEITGITTTSATPNCPGVFAQNVTLSVNPLPTLTGASQAATVCDGSGATINLTGLLASSISTVSYTINGGSTLTVTGVSADGSGAASFTSAALTAGNNGQILEITGITTTSATPNCNKSFTQDVTLSVNPLPATITGITTVCIGSTTTLSDATPLGTWSSGTTGVATVDPATGVVTGVSAGTSVISYTVTATGCFVTTTATVNPNGEVNPITSQVVCNNTSTTLINFSTTNIGGTTSYTWTNDQTSIGLAASGTSDHISAFTATNSGTSPVVATITVTPHFLNVVTCDGPSQTFTITVNPTGEVNPIASQVVCNNTSTTLVTFGTTNTGGTTSYTWTNDQTSIGLAASGTGNISAFTATNSGTAPLVATITVTPHFLNGLVTCDGPTQTFTITVNPTGEVNPIASQVVCNSTSTTLVTFGTTNTGGTTSYTWTNDQTSIGLAASGTSDHISAFTATNSGTAPVVATIVVTPHFLNGLVTCDGPTQTFTITVNPTGEVDAISNQVVCNNTSTTLVTFGTTNTGGTTSYTWTNDYPSIGLAASGTGNISAFTATNSGTAPVVATIVVTPHFLNGAVTCDGPTQTFTITVNPTGEVNPIASQVVCNNTSTTLVTFGTNNTGGTTTYTWTNDQTSIGIAASGTLDHISAFVATNSGTSPIVATIVVTPHFLNGLVTCDGPTQTFTITVNPTGQVNLPANQALCSGTSTSTVTFSTNNTGGTTTYSWTNDHISIGLAASGTGNISAFTSVNNGTVPVTANIVVTPHFTNGAVTCDGPTQAFTIKVDPLPTLSSASPAAAVCETFPATINLTGLLPGSISTVSYTINSGSTLTATTTTADGSGAATFPTRALTPADNGKILSVTGLITTNATSNCSQTFSKNSLLIVNTGSIPTISGNFTPCVNSTSNVYTTESGMSNYLWSVSAGGAITSGGTATDNTITITWNTAGSPTVSVNYTNTNGCTGSSPTLKTVTVGSLPVPTISGPSSVCLNSAGNIYTTEAGMLSYSWSVPAGGTITAGGSGNMIIVTWTAAGSRTVTVNYTNTGGCAASSPTIYSVTVNPLPVPTLSGPATPRVSSGSNVYSTETLMTNYVWTVSGGGTVTGGGTSTDNTVTVTWNTAGAQTVHVNYTNGNNCTAASSATYNLTVKPLPVASSASVSGIPAVGSLLTGSYSYTDGNGGTESGSTYRWLRNGTTPISGATSITYTPTISDVDQTITFEVTPASSVGPPYSGTPVQSSPTLSVENLIGVPVVDQVCIEGIRAAGDTLKGKYRYIYAYKSEGVSTYQWYLNNIPISGATGLQYVIQPSDITSGQEITFGVTPVSSNHAPRSGAAVKSNYLARIKLTQLSYSLADPAFPLVANVPNGIFSGKGVSNGSFSPAVADTVGSPHNVNYLLNIVNSSTTCSQQDNVSIVVVAIGASFVGLKDIYCYDGNPFTISVTNIPTGSTSLTFSSSNPASIVGYIDSTKVIIDPRKMRHKIYTDTLHFSYIYNHSHFPISKTYQTDSVGVASINNLHDHDVFCNNDTPFKLFPSLAGPDGVFTGPIKNDTLFNPNFANGLIRDTAVIFTYTHTNSAHCFSTVRVPVRINPSPVVSFNAASVCVVSLADTTRFVNHTTSLDHVQKWSWEFFDAGGSVSDTSKNPGYLFKLPGDHRVILTATTNLNCTATPKDTTIGIGFKPVANFYWRNECYHPNDSIIFRDTTSSSSTILSRTWKFGISPVIVKTGVGDVVKNTKFIKADTGYLSVKYIVRTSYSNCNDSITKSIYIRPTIPITTTDYFQNFETGQGGWVKDTVKLNSWTFGKPNRPVIDSAASGTKAWYTNFNITNQTVESSSVVSPCFDFSAIQRPMISMKLFKRFDKNRDGAALQYRIKDSAWVYVGSLDDGINWYNSTLIKGRPGGDQIGWTTGTAQDMRYWQSSHTLDDLSGKKDVEFRIAYGSDGTGVGNEGLAFDDIRIGQRTRKVLLEHFTNLSSIASSNSNTTVSELAKSMKTDVINIQYHTNFPGADAYYNDNPGDASARFLFYGLSKAPYSFIDGGTNINFANVYDYVLAPIDSNDLIRRSMINPLFAITMNSTVAGGIITVNGQIKALGSLNAENVTLYLAVTEKKNSSQTGALGEKIFYNVFRKLIPDAAGISLKKVWVVNDTYTIPDNSWPIAKIANSSDIEVIAFIQNNITKEIYQAQSNLQLNIIVGIDNVPANGKGFSLYPNPASDKLTISFENSLQSESDIMIYDFKGTVIRTYKSGSGQSEFTIDDLGLKNGIYLVRIKSGGLDWGFKKLIVSKF